MNFEFMTIDTPLPPCMPFPRALTGFPVSSTAKVMYCRMLDAMPVSYTHLDVYKRQAISYGKNNYECTGIICTDGNQPAKGI